MGKPYGYDVEPGQTWEVDFFRPEDAEGVTRLFLSVYGEAYPIKTFIQPEVLIRENESGRTISSVARTPKGDIVGHTALFGSAPYEGVRESGGGLVHASYRGGGINREIIRHSYEEATRKSAVETAFGEAVCNHVFMQKIVYGLHFEYQALEVDLMPDSAYEKEGSAEGRVAAITAFRTYRPKPHRVFIPAVYEEAFRYLYSGLDDRREILLSGGRPPSHSTTRVDVSYFDFAKVARLAVWEAGADFAPVLEAEEKKVLQQGRRGYPGVAEPRFSPCRRGCRDPPGEALLPGRSFPPLVRSGWDADAEDHKETRLGRHTTPRRQGQADPGDRRGGLAEGGKK